MISKPSSCMGCPLYHNGEYFTPDTIVPNSTVLFIAQNPGPNEEAGQQLIKRHWSGNQYMDEFVSVQPAPLIGATGWQFDRDYLPHTGLNRSQVSLANAIRCRPGHSLGLRSDDLPNLTSTMKLESSKADIVRALKHCRDAHLHIPSAVKLIVTMGRYAMFALTGIQNEESEYSKRQGVVQSWRGYAVDIPSTNHFTTVDTSYYHSLTSDKNIFFTMHIAALNKGDNNKFKHAALQDFYKIGRLLRGEWPLPLPTWHSSPPVVWPKYSAFDTEYNPVTGDLHRWSLCDTDNNLYCVESEDTGSAIALAPSSTLLIQNALADIGHFADIIGVSLSKILDKSFINLEDMMLAHSVLWTGEPHSLNYINSLYGAFNRYKHLSSDNPQLYSALDAYEPMYMWRSHFIPEFKKDQQSWQVYKKYRLPLIKIIEKAQRTGVKVDTARLADVQRILVEQCEELKEQARAIIGDSNFSLGGRKDMMKKIYG